MTPSMEVQLTDGTATVTATADGNSVLVTTAVTMNAPVPPDPVPPDPSPDPDDGSANAPTGAAQFPGLLDQFAHKPAWKVAGVDYRVGSNYAPHTDAANIRMVGVSVNAGSKYISIDADNIELEGVDFTNWYLIVRGKNAHVHDCLFRLGSSAAWYAAQVYGDDFTIEYCEVDGTQALNQASGMIAVYGQNPTARYVWFHDFPQHAIEMVQDETKTTTLDYRFCLLSNGGKQQGAHYNGLQWNKGHVTTAVVAYNTVMQQKQVAGGECFQFYGNFSPWSCDDGQLHHCTLYSEGGTASDPAISYGLNLTGGVGKCHDNMFGLKSAYGPIYPVSTNSLWVFENNIDMATGKVVTAPVR